jgi:5'-nucleotidase
MKSILLTNDDGFFSTGISALKKNLEQRFQVYIVAPDVERSAISMALTLNQPLRIQEIDKNVFAVNGTTSDCINIAMQKILPKNPDFVVSGMNLGENVSEDVLFSGTVGGAFCGYLYGIPALATSMIPSRDNDGRDSYDFDRNAGICCDILDKLLNHSHGPVVYNLNIPDINNGQVRITRLGYKRYKPDVIERLDPRGKKYYWIGTGQPEYNGECGTDVWAIKNGFISLSVVQYDLNCLEEARRLQTLFP